MMKRTWYTFLAVLLAAMLLAGCDANKKPYEAAQGLFSSGSYAEAAEAFSALGEYEDAQQMHEKSVYEYGRKLLEAGEYAGALMQLQQVAHLDGADKLIAQAENGVSYMEACAAREAGNLPYAASLFYKAGAFEDAAAQLREVMERERYLSGFISASAAQNAAYMLDHAGRVYSRSGGLTDQDAVPINAGLPQIEGARWLGTGANSLLFVNGDGALMQYDSGSGTASRMHNSAIELENVHSALHFMDETTYALTMDGVLYRCTIAYESVEMLSGIARIKSAYPACVAIGYTGEVWHWLWDDPEAEPEKLTGLSGVGDIAAYYPSETEVYTLFLMLDGTLRAGKSSPEASFPARAEGLVEVQGVENAVQIAGCYNGLYARRQDGRILKITFGAGADASSAKVAELDLPKAAAIKANAMMDKVQGIALPTLHLLTEDGAILAVQGQSHEEIILFDTEERAELADAYAQAAALEAQGGGEKASEAFLALGVYIDSQLRGLEGLFDYYDAQFNAGVDLSALPIPFDETLYTVKSGAAQRKARSEALEQAMETLGHGEFLKKTAAAKSPVEVTGKGIYVHVAAAGTQQSASNNMKNKILQDVPIFFIAEKPENARYIVVIDASYSRYGKYTDGSSGYTTSAKVYINDALTGKRLLNKTYKERPPYSKNWGSGDSYGFYNLIGTGNGYEKDVKPYLMRLAAAYSEKEE